MSSEELEQEIARLRRRLERSEENRELLEIINDRNQALLRSLNTELAREKNRSDTLLLNVMPVVIAERLKAGAEVIADSYPAVSVLFADLVGFTELSSKVTPEALVDMLNAIFSDFDSLVAAQGLEKIKTIGDAYMAAAGVPAICADHVERAAGLALSMLEALARFNARHNQSLALRIGIHTGPVVAGVIGRQRFIYDLWGDTVNTASRMESHGAPGRVHVSDATAQSIKHAFTLEARGSINVKGKGQLTTWFVVGRRTSAALT